MSMPTKRTGAQILWECLVREGVTTVFGYPGGAILPAYDAMLDYPVRHVLARHEHGATHMADGDARARGGAHTCPMGTRAQADAGAWRLPHPDLARPTWSPDSRRPSWTRPRLSASPARAAGVCL